MKYALIVLILTLTACGKGVTGPVGERGDEGPRGEAGINGMGCTVTAVASSTEAPNGGALITCSSTQSLILNGSNGQDGVSPTLIQPIQFCPGVPSYPNVFPEIGFCINHEIYAVYSSLGGFLTKIEVGTWVSNAIGSSCTFTVSADCHVSH